MKTLFNFNRFGLLVRKHANETRRLFLISVICMFVPAILVRLIVSNPTPKQLYIFYILFLLYSGAIYTGVFLKKWTHKSRATAFLMLPVTAFERIAVVLLFTIVLFIPLFTIIFYGSSLLLFKMSHPMLPFSIGSLFEGGSFLTAFCLYVILPFTLFQSFCLLFAVWLKKGQVFIAMAVIVAFFILNNILVAIYMKGLNGGIVNFMGNQIALFPDTVSYYSKGNFQKVSSPLISDISILVYIVMAILFYLVSYFKLKEKEI